MFFSSYPTQTLIEKEKPARQRFGRQVYSVDSGPNDQFQRLSSSEDSATALPTRHSKPKVARNALTRRRSQGGSGSAAWGRVPRGNRREAPWSPRPSPSSPPGPAARPTRQRRPDARGRQGLSARHAWAPPSLASAGTRWSTVAPAQVPVGLPYSLVFLGAEDGGQVFRHFPAGASDTAADAADSPDVLGRRHRTRRLSPRPS